jgi:hypothetical protein
MYGIGQGFEKGVEHISQMLFTAYGIGQRNRLLDLDQQRVNLAKRAQSLKAFGHPSAWENLDRSPSLSPAASTTPTAPTAGAMGLIPPALQAPSLPDGRIPSLGMSPRPRGMRSPYNLNPRFRNSRLP